MAQIINGSSLEDVQDKEIKMYQEEIKTGKIIFAFTQKLEEFRYKPLSELITFLKGITQVKIRNFILKAIEESHVLSAEKESDESDFLAEVNDKL